ncbi:hypothetical protein [Alteriqipengyuania lutimaris]|uniref:hypothetical protein n=1 Tax=Alteriqipengyuania lutimaris TaxID=1538146 RepID=UPI001CFCFE30|nr:hypothetical protein [Alteriqipengyuania lutimaris]
MSDLVEVCSEKRVDAARTLNVFARRLREAERVTKAGRGRGAARMSYLDSSHFLSACGMTDRPERSADAEHVLSSSVFESGTVSGPRSWLTKEDAPTFDIGLANLLSAIGSGEIDRYNEARAKDRANGGPIVVTPPNFEVVIFRSSVAALIRFPDAEYRYQHPLMAAVCAASTYAEQQTLLEAFERETDRFRSAKNIVVTFEADLLRAVATTIEGGDLARLTARGDSK